MRLKSGDPVSGSTLGSRRRARGDDGIGLDAGEDLILYDSRKKLRCFTRVWDYNGTCVVALRLYENRRTAASASAIIFSDFSRSRFSCAASAISDARNRRFSTLRRDIWALSSSMRTLSVELSLLPFSLSHRPQKIWQIRTL